MFQEWQAKFTLDSAAIEQLKVTFLIVCVFYILLTLPKFGYMLFKYLVDRHEVLAFSHELEAKQMLAHAVCASLEYIFLSTKFFIYFASSRRFRREFKRVLQCCRKKKVLVCSPSSSYSTSRPLIPNGISQRHQSISNDINEEAEEVASVRNTYMTTV